MWEMDYDSAAEYWTKKDKESARMEERALKQRIEEFITGHNTCALATATADMVRNTPIEYNYADGHFYFFSEGGLKFMGLRENKNVGLAIFEPYKGFSNIKGLQAQGVAEIIEPFSDEYLKVLENKKISKEAIKRIPHPMNLIRVEVKSYDFLDSDLKKEGFGYRQHLCVS
jgi:hypothetical protein